MCLAALLCCTSVAFSQINFTANDIGRVPAYDGYFYYGVNGGWFDGTWDDNSLADIAVGNPSKNIKGVGVKSFRPFLPEKFVDYWGYRIRVPEFTYAQSLGARDVTVNLGEPKEDSRDKTKYNGCAQESMMFRNLYEPIWDAGANGTPVNENNIYATYVYKLVLQYKDFTKFWEVMNEPDYDAIGNSMKNRGEAGNWWENNPDPCHMPNMRAPIFHYIRMLRISYEVIKSVDPTAYVATGGLGYVSFLDVILRNTDNPVDGSVTAEYPNKGGAYFDCLSYHSYPMYVLRHWSNAVNGFVYRRHSDAAVVEHINGKKLMDSVLNTRGYNGTTYPKKIFICTEGNVPRKAFGDHIGSVDAQKNYIMKANIESQMNDVRQFYSYMLGDTEAESSASEGYQVMGLYYKLNGTGPMINVNGVNINSGNYRQQPSPSGIAMKTLSDQLFMKRYDAAKTATLNLPANVGGGAFKDANGKYTYVLWMKTFRDQSEESNGSWLPPANIGLAGFFDRREWNFSTTNTTTQISATVAVPLTSTPSFFTERLELVPLPPNPNPDPEHPTEDNRELAFKIYPNPTNAIPSIRFTLREATPVRVTIHAADGKLIGVAIPGRTYDKGTHIVPLTITQSLSGGVYLCRFEADKFFVMKKLVIAR